jgi:hypothetical protein
MKWYSTKKSQPSYDGWYIVRFSNCYKNIDLAYTLWGADLWLDYSEEDNLFKGAITHFAIPDPVEAEE